MRINVIYQNFLANAAEAQLVESLIDSDGKPTAIGATLEHIDTFFTVVFTVELVINAYAHWFWSFALDGWNAFDTAVVALSLVALGPIAMPINVLRSLRAFRVVRLFGRMAALRDIVASVTAAVVPVLNAFLVMLIVASICNPSERGEVIEVECVGECEREVKASYSTRGRERERTQVVITDCENGLIGSLNLPPCERHRIKLHDTCDIDASISQTRFSERPSSGKRRRSASGGSTCPSSPCSAWLQAWAGPR
jgi:hypothetical protein